MELNEEYRKQLIVRLENSFTLNKISNCWIWNKTSNDKGYGKTKVHGKTVRVHRLSYELYVGPIPEGAIVHHKCSTTSCFNPEHLQCTSHIQNSAEMLQRRWYISKIKELEEEIKLLKD